MTPAEDWQRLALWVAKRYATHRDAEDIRQEALLGAWLGIQRVRAKGLARCQDRQAAVKGAQWAVSEYLRRGKRRVVDGKRIVVEEPAWMEELRPADLPASDGGISIAELRLELWLQAQRTAPPARGCRFCGHRIEHRNTRARYCDVACKAKAADTRRPAGWTRAKRKEAGVLPMRDAHGPQIVVCLDRREGDERIHRTLDFAEAGRLWREGQQRMCGPGGYSVWINDGDIWRSSGLLDDAPRALAIRDRVTSRYGLP